MTVGFVLGGGGVLGAAEVGMLRALLEAGIRPDVVVGTSIGAVNGVAIAADPSLDAVERLTTLWTSERARTVYGDSAPRQLARFARTGTHLHVPDPLRTLLLDTLGGDLEFADLAVPFQCCAASIERSAEHWFSKGSVVDAVLASSAVPGFLPPMPLDGEHFVDGGIVNSIPLGRAVELGATEVYVLQVGRIDKPLTAPKRPWDVARVAFEIARRHRYARELADLPPDVTAYVLPVGEPVDDSPRAYRDFRAVRRRIDRAYAESVRYLADRRRT